MSVTSIKTAAKALPKKSRPPRHLSRLMKDFWQKVVAGWKLEDHHLLILSKACEAHDRADEARKTLKTEGTTYKDRFNQPCARPEIAIERDSRLAFARMIRELGLSEEPEAPRPPSLKYRR